MTSTSSQNMATVLASFGLAFYVTKLHSATCSRFEFILLGFFQQDF